MDGKIATLAGAAALVAAPAVGAAPQAPEPAVPVAASYAELLNPIPDAPARLQQADLQDAAAARLIPVQYYGDYRDDRGYRDHHHHHHHNHYNRSWYLNHGYYWFGGRWVLRPVRRYNRYDRYHHHHHHHHHHNYY